MTERDKMIEYRDSLMDESITIDDLKNIISIIIKILIDKNII